ncbi:helix-turn-helix domain-containing protein [Nocardia flavorosea]|uniref:PucR family transcriptional regulator n=1 Tax=Nocardia flavorosea TaxID=53429 RepID=UPI001895C588|nr:helix-turn-helix domain-containing protein [Nocardia flavorosea]MBF6351493.1 helix-turn-helix domain-containing protein [Nocardia flavorosea]
MADLAVEYQITRPGPARRRLAKSLDPLLPQPELLETLSTHLAYERNRQRTARALYVHANTVDYRLRRIARLTGLDPADSEGLWHLQAAMIANAYETTHASDRHPEVPIGPAVAGPARPPHRCARRYPTARRWGRPSVDGRPRLRRDRGPQVVEETAQGLGIRERAASARWCGGQPRDRRQRRGLRGGAECFDHESGEAP